MVRFVKRFTMASGFVAAATFVAHAQWLTFRDPQLPRTRDGQPNLSAPAPRTSGHPDLSGVWQVEATPTVEMQNLFGGLLPVSVLGDDTYADSKYFLTLLVDVPATASPMRPEPATLFRQLMVNRGR